MCETCNYSWKPDLFLWQLQDFCPVAIWPTIKKVKKANKLLFRSLFMWPIWAHSIKIFRYWNETRIKKKRKQQKKKIFSIIIVKTFSFRKKRRIIMKWVNQTRLKSVLTCVWFSLETNEIISVAFLKCVLKEFNNWHRFRRITKWLQIKQINQHLHNINRISTSVLHT